MKRIVLGLLLVALAGCDLKFPGPKINFGGPDASILGNFAGSGSVPGAFPGAAGSGSPSVGRAPQVIEARLSVSGSAPTGMVCPAGRVAVGGVCQLRSGVARQCSNGGTLCPSGQCCAAGFSCGATGACERAPGGASQPAPGVCASGQLVTSAGSNCPATTRPHCCPVGAWLQCTDPSNPGTAVCMLSEPIATNPCPGAYVQLTDTVTNTPGCCAPSTLPVQLVNGLCAYEDNTGPQCNGSLDPTTGACCAGQLSGRGCCSLGHQACGNGCCELGESCDSVTGQCISAQPAAAPVCPPQAARDCSSLGGQCCPSDSQCKPDGSCACPASTPVDCGGFCATSTEQCSCPSDHPDACGSQCCLRGGCGTGAPGAGPSCGCPSSTTMCGDNCCPSGSSCVGGQCLGCPSDAPTLCGNSCCGVGQTCMGGTCVSPQSPPPPIASDVPVRDAGVPSGGSSGGSSSSGGGGSVPPGSSGGGQSCQPVPAPCSTCTITACAAASAGGSCHSWYQSSDGRSFECSGCGDCSVAAQAAVAHCCPFK